MATPNGDNNASPKLVQSDAVSTYSLDTDSISILSDTSTLLQLNNFDNPGYGYSSFKGYGGGLSPVPSGKLAPWNNDSSYLNDKALPTVPNGVQYLPESRHRSRSPGRRRVHQSRRRLSPNPPGIPSSSKLPEQIQVHTVYTPPHTQLDALESALGPDGVPHTVELDTIPCAGIRIPNGPFTGLLAWRLVVRVHPVRNGKHPSAASLKKELLMLPKSDIRHAGNMPHQLGAGRSSGPAPHQYRNVSGGNGLPPPVQRLTQEERANRRMTWDPVNTPALVNGRRTRGVAGGPASPTALVLHRENPVHARTMSDLSAFSPLPPPRLPGGSQARTFAGRVSSDSATSLPLTSIVKSKSSTEANVSHSSREDDDTWSVLPSPTRPWGPSASSPALVPARGRASSSSPKRRHAPSSFFSPGSTRSQPQLQQHAAPMGGGMPPHPPPRPDAVISNFLYDSSLGHNTISRETLRAIGFSAKIIDALEASEIQVEQPYTSIMAERPSFSYPAELTSYSSHGEGMNFEPKTVSLYVQNLGKPITFRLAPAGEPSRLGVQFLLESDVNVCMGEGGRGAIMWVDRTTERKVMLQSVPRTVQLPKLTLQAKVKALFGIQ